MDWTEYTEEDHQARLEAMKELENWEVIEIDFEKIKNYKDFENLLENN